jgi:predicted patatin/cPLA2 family phospholipase
MTAVSTVGDAPPDLFDGPLVLRDPGTISHPVLRMIAVRTRALAAGEPRPADGATLALGVEGGGMATAMTCGMAWVLERLGATAAFDAVYGVSSGSIIATHFAAGEMVGATQVFPAACTREFIDPRRALSRRPVLSLDVLFELIRHHPIDRALDRAQPDLRIVVAGVDDGRLRTLRGFADLEDLVLAMRAGCAIPVISREVVELRGERLADGGLLESVPLHTPLTEGVSHLLALRSRDATYRKGGRGRLYGLLEDRVINREPGLVPAMIRARPARYDADAEALEHASLGNGDLAGRVLQLAPAPGTPLVKRLQLDRERVIGAMRAGARVAADALCEPA